MGFIWHPPKELVEESNVKAFMDAEGFSDYKQMVEKSTEDIEWWWSKAVEWLNVEWFKPYEKVYDMSKGIEWTDWFVNGRVNAAYNALDRHRKKRNKLAFIWQGEDGEVRRYTYLELYREVNRLANALKAFGVGKGDVVALYLPMFPETVVTLFAAMKIGAIAMPIFSGYSSAAIQTRLADSDAKVVVTADASYRRGRAVPLKPELDKALEGTKVEKVVVVNRADTEVEMKEDRDVYWDEVKESSRCETVEMDPNDAALLLYTSGTTGKPKGVVLSHAGVILQSSKEIFFNMDLKPEDVFLWITDIGWMMGPWQIIGCQHLGGTHVLFEGAPDYPNTDRIWAMIEEFEITQLGGSATVYRLLKRYGDEAVKQHDLSSLKATGNTGEPIDHDTWMWLLKVVGEERCPIINLSGGTEIFGCFLLPSPAMPLKPTTLGYPGLGMDVDVFDDAGNSVRQQIGYLVCKKPAPSMTRGFWKDPERYIKTYWSRWKGVWYHGDWAYVDEDGFWFLFGRADDVIKVAGKRMGPAEIETIVNSIPAVQESACIGVPHELKGEVVWVFVTLKPGYEPSEELEKEIVDKIVKEFGKPFKPDRVVFVPDLPRTRSGKIMRRLIKAVVAKQELGDTSALENPDSLEKIKEVLG
ncbi:MULTISPECIES: AMP-binding protein [Archaeoglobus]|uniref:acetate--CoA ligase n=2 Tax=Archaeoglobus fulgidus TaxID=2234 RepID=A0A075WJT3_ARCFL|nr:MULTISPECIES: AMP-binding protein [Archaeoglobus]AIG97848.1 Acyl-coenzyme A synthetase/AMP-(fatty) acid ligase [Archaeoglobus fulgidus DSM 8774]KUJ93156.1 MAG: Acetyl-CoA synthetase (Acs-4) [Archaeoglobus fulgidus]KUK06792.1 MAG: Acetyl-CoA synthetase (Acs-4) [Archaeoglobus fulgidus]MDI3498769.1 acetyl-CoA synthetase [Archaeoglobus sp.]